MSWFIPDFMRARAAVVPERTPNLPAPAAPANFDAWLFHLRDLRVAVPCAGCGGAHEMTCAEVLARQLLRGDGWPSEECDDGVMLHAILSPEDVIACAGDAAAVRDLLARRGLLCADGSPPPTTRTADAHRILLSV